MWTETTRPKYERDGLRYASDPRDGEWEVLQPLLPRVKALGRPRTTALREEPDRRGSTPQRPTSSKLPPWSRMWLIHSVLSVTATITCTD